MAKLIPVNGFLLSGRVGNAVYCCRGNTTYVRQWVRPKDPHTLPQIKRRGRFEAAVADWQQLPEDEKQKYRHRARYMQRTGYNLFLSEALAAPE